jgi:stalled ribosome rescue protein Dom34
MPQHFHAVVCIDHAEALVFDFTKDDVTEHRVEAKDRQGNIHHKAGSPEGGHAHDAKSYFAAVAALLQPSHEILIVGHGTARTDFAHFIRDHVPALAPRIMGVEAVDHPSKGEIVALARKFFESRDLATPQVGS